jgi:cytoskeletal protein RodZ
MKEIGEQFKEKREEIGISINEVASDLKTDPIIIENLEEGNRKVFKDVLELKEISSLYAKYLGLDSESILDEINDYLFEKTSKIDLDDLKDRIETIKKEEEKKRVRTPYTIEKDDNSSKTIFSIIVVLVIILVIFYILLRKLIIG